MGKIPWRRKWHSTPVFLPGRSQGQRSLAGYSPWDLKELDMIEQLTHRAIKTALKIIILSEIKTNIRIPLLCEIKK